MGQTTEPTVVALEGPRITLADQVNSLRDALFDHIEQGRVHLVLDFSDVEFVDSSFLGVMVIVLRRAIQNNGDMRLCCLQPAVSSLFHMMRLDRIYSMHETLESALESYQ